MDAIHPKGNAGRLLRMLIYFALAIALTTYAKQHNRRAIEVTPLETLSVEEMEGPVVRAPFNFKIKSNTWYVWPMVTTGSSYPTTYSTYSWGTTTNNEWVAGPSYETAIPKTDK